MKKSDFARGLSILLILVFALTACAPATATPASGAHHGSRAD